MVLIHSELRLIKLNCNHHKVMSNSLLKHFHSICFCPKTFDKTIPFLPLRCQVQTLSFYVSYDPFCTCFVSITSYTSTYIYLCLAHNRVQSLTTINRPFIFRQSSSHMLDLCKCGHRWCARLLIINP